MALWVENITEVMTEAITEKLPTSTLFDFWAWYYYQMEQKRKEREFRERWEEVYHYAASVLVWVSLFTNAMSVLVFATKKSKKEQTVNILLISLAIADSLSMTTAWDSAIYFWTDKNLAKSYNVGCKLVQYVTNVARDCSSYIILAFTIDRFVSVKFPLQKSLWITKTRVLTYLVAIVPIFAAMESYVPYYLKLWNGERCIAAYARKMNRLTLFCNNTVGFIVPAGLVAILNVMIIQQLGKWAAQRQAMTGKDKKEAKGGQNTALTVMLVGISTFSFLVSLPKVAVHFYSYYNRSSQGTAEGRRILKALFLTDSIRLLNYSCNFFFYCMSGSQFRDDLTRTVRRYFCCQDDTKYRHTGATSAATGSTVASTSAVSQAINETKFTNGEKNQGSAPV